MSADLRDAIFASLEGTLFTARIWACEPGLVCGLETAREKLEALGLAMLHTLKDGDVAREGEDILMFRGEPRPWPWPRTACPGPSPSPRASPGPLVGPPS